MPRHCVSLALAAASAAAAKAPCDILGAAGNPCVAAHSTVRALYAAYDGPLYNVTRASDGQSALIGVLSAGGFANKAAHDKFCAKLDCVISNVMDQSGKHNNLGRRHKLVNASLHPITVGKDKTPVYGMWFEPGYGYHVDDTTGIATGNDPESIYAVMSGKNFNGGCCFDYGNSETNDRDDGAGTMEAIYFGNAHWRGHGVPGSNTGAGAGPWVGADLENGMYYGGGNVSVVNNQNKPLTSDFVSLVLKGRTDGFTLKGGDATRGAQAVMYDGPRPFEPMPGTAPTPSECAPAGQAGVALQKCAAGSSSQTWGFAKDGKSIGSCGSCLDIHNWGTGKGASVSAYPCGGNGVKNEQFWALDANGTIASLQPNTPFCLGVKGATAGSAAVLDDCAAPSAVFTVGFSATSGSKGTIVHKASGLCLTSAVRPGRGYQPAKKQGAIILATGGDNSNGAKGCFYEGFMATGYASAATDAAIQENVIAVGYSGWRPPA